MKQLDPTRLWGLLPASHVHAKEQLRESSLRRNVTSRCCLYSHNIASNGRMMNEAEDLKGNGPNIWKENHEGLESRLAGIVPETGTEHLQNRNLERYRALTRSIHRKVSIQGRK